MNNVDIIEGYYLVYEHMKRQKEYNDEVDRLNKKK